MADNPLLPFTDAVNDTVSAKWWLFLLGGLELLRQIHYLVAERSPRYYAFWTQKVFGRFDRLLEQVNPWTRFRFARAIKWIVVLRRPVDRARRDLRLDARRSRSSSSRSGSSTHCRSSFQLMFAVFFVIVQFAAIFWFLSRGGVDVYYPRRREDPLQRRVGPGRGRREGEGEPHLPREPGVDRGEGRLRPRRHPALRARPAPARRSWPRRSRARPASRTCSSTPAPSSRCSWASAC